MAPRKGSRQPPLATVYNELEKSLSSNCAAVLDAATAQIGDVRLPLIAGITTKNDLWTVLHKYKMVCFSLESRVVLLSVVTDFLCGCAVTPAIADPFLHDSNYRSLFTVFDKLGKEWDYAFQAIHSLPRSKRFQECKIKAVHSILSRWAVMVDSSLMSKLQSRASEICFKLYGLEPLKRGTLNCGKYTAEKCSPNKENDEAPALLNIKLEMKRLCLGSLQLNRGKDQLLQLYLGEEIVLGIQSAGKQEIGIVLRKEHLDGVVVYLGDDESFCEVRDMLFLYPNNVGCSVIMEALTKVTDGCPPPLISAQGEDRRILVHCKRKVKEDMVDNVVALLRRLVGNKVVEVDQEFSEALLNKRKKASRLFSSGTKENKRDREEESLNTGKEAKVMKQSLAQKIQNRKTLESIENVRLRCFHCGFDISDKSALNAHILSHFSKEFLKMLPGFNCPQCSYKNIDRKRLSYHYAFVHMKILDYVTKEQLRGIAKVDTFKPNTAMTMQGDIGVAGIKDTKEVDCGMYDAKMMSFDSSDSASDNFDESFSSLPDINRSIGSNCSSDFSDEEMQQPKEVSNQQLQQPNKSKKNPQKQLQQQHKSLQVQILHPKKSSEQKIMQPKNVSQYQSRKDQQKFPQPLVTDRDIPLPRAAIPLTVTAQLTQTPQGPKIILQDLTGIQLDHDQEMTIQETVKLELQKQRALARQEGRVPPTRVCVLFPANVHPIKTKDSVHHHQSTYRGSIQQPKEVLSRQMHKSFSVDPSATAMTETNEKYMNLLCGLVRIGSYPVSPQDKTVVIHENWLEMRVRDVFQESVVTVRVDVTEIQSALVSFSDVLPLLVLHLTPVSCAVLMEILGMNQKNKFETNKGVFCIYSNSCIDSNGESETQKRIIFFLEKITKDAENALRNFLKDDLTELRETEAKEILLKSGHLIKEDNRPISLVLPDKKPTKEVEQSDESSMIQNEPQDIPKPTVVNVTRKDTDPAMAKTNQSPTISMKSGCSCDDCVYVTPTHRARMERKNIQCSCHPCKIGRLEESQEKSVTKLMDKVEKEPSKNEDVEEENELKKNEVVPWKLVPVQKYEGEDYWSEPWIDDLLREINQAKVSIVQAANMTGTSYWMVYNKYVKMFGKIKRCK